MPKDYARRARRTPTPTKPRVTLGRVVAFAVLSLLLWVIFGYVGWSRMVAQTQQGMHAVQTVWKRLKAAPSQSVPMVFYAPDGHKHRGALRLALPLFPDRSALREMKARLSQAGLPVITSQVWLHDRWWYQLELGPFTTMRQAYHASQRLQAMGLRARLHRMTG